MICVESAGISDIGRRRESNEDRICLDDAHGLYMVADGMGGHQAGEVASRLVVESILEFITHDDGGEEQALTHAFTSRAERLLAGIRRSNRLIHAAAEANDKLRGMGSTLAAVWLTRESLIAANVGDSSIYLIREGRINLLSVPHTLQAEGGDPDGGLFGSHILTRAMGPRPEVEPDVSEIACCRNDLLILCSDGLTTKVAPWEILAIAEKRSPAAGCRALVDLANERGGDDNVSTVVVRVKRVGRGGLERAGRLLRRILQRPRNEENSQRVSGPCRA